MTVPADATFNPLLNIPENASGLCPGVIPGAGVYPHTAWIISDGQSRFYFDNVSPIGTMRGASRTESRFTSMFPCNRITQHVAVETNMAIYAVASTGRKIPQPAGFPIYGIKTNDVKIPVLKIKNVKIKAQLVTFAIGATNRLDDLNLLQKKLAEANIESDFGSSDRGEIPLLVEVNDFQRAHKIAVKIIQENSLTTKLEADALSYGYQIWKNGKKIGEQYF